MWQCCHRSQAAAVGGGVDWLTVVTTGPVLLEQGAGCGSRRSSFVLGPAPPTPAERRHWATCGSRTKWPRLHPTPVPIRPIMQMKNTTLHRLPEHQRALPSVRVPRTFRAFLGPSCHFPLACCSPAPLDPLFPMAPPADAPFFPVAPAAVPPCCCAPCGPAAPCCCAVDPAPPAFWLGTPKGSGMLSIELVELVVPLQHSTTRHSMTQQDISTVARRGVSVTRLAIVGSEH